MLLSNIPAKIAAIFAASGTKNTIPLTTAGVAHPNNASFDVGFPPLTMTPVISGGLPPFGADFNGLMNDVTAVQQWQSAGGLFTYDATFSAAIGGYPKGALLLAASGVGFWQSTADDNTTNPDAGGAGWVNFAAQSSGVVGNFRNAKMAVSAATSAATFTADEIMVEIVLGSAPWKLSSYSQAVNLGATGAGGMDMGTAPVSGYVALYAIYKPNTNTASILAVNATSAAAPNIYGGANMPVGYTASALISVWPTNASSQFVPGIQQDRAINIVGAPVVSSSTAQTWISQSIASVVPPSAKSISGYFSAGCSTAGGASLYIASSANGVGMQIVETPVGSTYVAAASFSNLLLTTPQVIYYQTNAGGGTNAFFIAITGYSF